MKPLCPAFSAFRWTVFAWTHIKWKSKWYGQVWKNKRSWTKTRTGSPNHTHFNVSLRLKPEPPTGSHLENGLYSASFGVRRQSKPGRGTHSIPSLLSIWWLEDTLQQEKKKKEKKKKRLKPGDEFNHIGLAPWRWVHVESSILIADTGDDAQEFDIQTHTQVRVNTFPITFN